MDKVAVRIGPAFASPIGQDVTLGDLVSVLLSNAVALAGIIVFILFILGGIGVLVGAGRDDPQATAKGKQAVTAAVIGFIIIFATYWIIQIIEEITGVSILRPF